LIFICNAQPDLERAEKYCQRILSVAKHFKAKRAVGFAAMPQPVDHTEKPKVWCSATTKALNEALKKHGVSLLTHGQISGMNGLFLGLAAREKLDGFCLLGEIPLYTVQIENPKAAAAVLEVLGRIVGVAIRLNALMEQAQAMEGEIEKLMEYLRVGNPSAGPINEEEIERIKHALSQLTKLPTSVKEGIEKLFSEARADIAKANELKHQLDKWNVYKDYEDRFLDLFKKSNETSS